MVEQKMKILIIEDDRMQAEDLKEQLEEFGYDVLDPAYESVKALHLFKKYNPDLTLVDITLKDSPLNGIQLVKRFNEIRKIPIIFLTGNFDDKTKKSVKEVAPNNYLIKPVSPQQLDVAIDFALFDFMRQQGQKVSKSDLYIPYNDTKGYIFIKHKNNYIKINPHDILYLKTSDFITRIVLEYNQYYLSSSLTDMIKKIDCDFIVRTNRSHAVNIHKMLSFSNTAVHIINGNTTVEIPLSATYKNDFHKRIRIIHSS